MMVKALGGLRVFSPSLVTLFDVAAHPSVVGNLLVCSW